MLPSVLDGISSHAFSPAALPAAAKLDCGDAVVDVKLRVAQCASVVNDDAHERVVDHDESPRRLRERREEMFHRPSKADRGLERRHQVGS